MTNQLFDKFVFPLGSEYYNLKLANFISIFIIRAETDDEDDDFNGTNLLSRSVANCSITLSSDDDSFTLHKGSFRENKRKTKKAKAQRILDSDDSEDEPETGKPENLDSDSEAETMNSEESEAEDSEVSADSEMSD